MCVCLCARVRVRVCETEREREIEKVMERETETETTEKLLRRNKTGLEPKSNYHFREKSIILFSIIQSSIRMSGIGAHFFHHAQTLELDQIRIFFSSIHLYYIILLNTVNRGLI